MKYNIHLLSYNNYYNRQVKKLNSIADYNDYLISTVNNVNFEMKDGILSKLIINSSFVPTLPDYILVVERDTDGDDSDNFSRWFIIDSELIRGNQYEFTVKRDICVDYNDLLLNSTFFVERGYVNPSNDLVFNDEGQLYSQIKKSQVLLRDETYGPWIVGYIPRKGAIGAADKTVTSTAYSNDADITVADITSWSYYDYCNINPDRVLLKGPNPNMSSIIWMGTEIPILEDINGTKSKKLLKLNISYDTKSASNIDTLIYPSNVGSPTTIATGVSIRDFNIQTDTYFNDFVIDDIYGWGLDVELPYTSARVTQYQGMLNKLLERFSNENLRWSELYGAIRTKVGMDQDTIEEIQNNIANKTIKDLNTGKTYTMVLNQQYTNEDVYFDDDPTNTARINYFLSYLNGYSTSLGTSSTNYGATSVSTREKYVARFRVYICTYRIDLVENYKVKAVLPKDDAGDGTVYRNHLVDAPYDMFCIPYNDNLYIKNVGLSIYPSKEAGLAIATEISNTLGADALYDIQILPYCPVRQYIQNDNSFDITVSGQSGGTGNKYITPIIYGNDDTPINYIFWCSSSKIEDITLLNPEDTFNPYKITIDNVKESCNLDVYRLCSPNYASIFEFSPAKNGGVINFKFSATYKPYNPYIRIHPQFGRLYGGDFKDARGLILQGDFSIPALSNAWANYELQNKNYQNTFNREIQSLTLQNKIASEEDIIRAVTGTIQGGVGGAMAGGITAGPYGAIAGAVAGLTMSGVAGAYDVSNNRKLRNDAISKAKTLFNYNLQNIQAIPSTIRNVGCLTTDNLLIPLLEYYSASDDEIDTFRKKIQFYGMTVNKVGNLLEYVETNKETFVQGYLLRLLPTTNINEEADNHLAEELSDEVQKGIYLTVTST